MAAGGASRCIACLARNLSGIEQLKGLAVLLARLTRIGVDDCHEEHSKQKFRGIRESGTARLISTN